MQTRCVEFVLVTKCLGHPSQILDLSLRRKRLRSNVKPFPPPAGRVCATMGDAAASPIGAEHPVDANPLLT